MQMAACYIQQKRFDRAIEACDQALRADASNTKALYVTSGLVTPDPSATERPRRTVSRETCTRPATCSVQTQVCIQTLRGSLHL